MIANLYLGNGCFTKHAFKTGCLGFQVGILHFCQVVKVLSLTDSTDGLSACEKSFSQLLFWDDSVDGRSPKQPPNMYETLVNNGKNMEKLPYQLVLKISFSHQQLLC